MMLSRWRRVATGVAAGIIVLCAALIGASFRDDNGGVSVASDLRPANVIPIAEDPIDDLDAADGADADTADSVDTGSDDTGSVDAAETAAGDATQTTEGDTTEGETSTDPVTVIDADDLPDADDGDAGDAGESDTADTATNDTATNDGAADTSGDAAADTTVDNTAGSETAAATTSDTGSAGQTTADETLGIGGGVDDAECALDRLVIYAGARRGGVASSIRNALAAAGFATGCPAPVTVLASNCPLQFAGVLGAGSGYDPMGSFVASSSSVHRETMTAVMAAVGYSGAEINILDFSFINPDKPGEQWMAIFIPPTFAGWENLASRAGLSPTTSSLCASSGELAG